jgi:hypothetical protein
VIDGFLLGKTHVIMDRDPVKWTTDFEMRVSAVVS